VPNWLDITTFGGRHDLAKQHEFQLVTMKSITIGGISVDVKRKGIRNIHLAVCPPAGRVRISVPARMSDEAIRLFIVSKLGWIQKHREKFENLPKETPREYLEGESHYFQGRQYHLRIHETTGAGYVECNGTTHLDLYVKGGSDKAYRERVLNDWYRRELKKLIPGMIVRWEGQLGVTILDWGVKQMKTRWGSCNTRAQRIWLNLELAKKPVQCLEYVLVHEMVHLLERHHNQRFRDLMTAHLPNWKELKVLLTTQHPVPENSH
jgi:predicted metal-dependent hydrolase